ncbi:uncharacterized protein BDZ99DRAFT_373776, partial [Mytilinidion resinicola]
KTGNEINEKPFSARQTGKTIVKYSACWLAIVCYIWRTRRIKPICSEEIEKSESEGDIQN